MTTPKITPSEQTGQSPTNREYVCTICRVKFVSEWTDEEAKEELKEKFGETNIQECEVVCEDCYNKLMEKVNEV